MSTETRTCKICKKVLPVEEFPTDGRGVSKCCSDCSEFRYSRERHKYIPTIEDCKIRLGLIIMNPDSVNKDVIAAVGKLAELCKWLVVGGMDKGNAFSGLSNDELKSLVSGMLHKEEKVSE